MVVMGLATPSGFSLGFFFFRRTLHRMAATATRRGETSGCCAAPLQAPRPARRAPRDPTPAPQVLPRPPRNPPQHLVTAPAPRGTPAAHSRCVREIRIADASGGDDASGEVDSWWKEAGNGGWGWKWLEYECSSHPLVRVVVRSEGNGGGGGPEQAQEQARCCDRDGERNRESERHQDGRKGRSGNLWRAEVSPKRFKQFWL